MVVNTIVSSQFEVTSWNEEPVDDRPDAAKITCAEVTKTYSGEIEGDSVTEWLMAYADDGSAAFVGLERIVGTVGGRTGTLVLQHVGAYDNGAATAQLRVVDRCGTGELAGATGTAASSPIPPAPSSWCSSSGARMEGLRATRPGS